MDQRVIRSSYQRGDRLRAENVRLKQDVKEYRAKAEEEYQRRVANAFLASSEYLAKQEVGEESRRHSDPYCITHCSPGHKHSHPGRRRTDTRLGHAEPRWAYLSVRNTCHFPLFADVLWCRYDDAPEVGALAPVELPGRSPVRVGFEPPASTDGITAPAVQTTSSTAMVLSSITATCARPVRRPGVKEMVSA
jgi:hypothetical protein